MTDEQRASFLDAGMGISNLVERATVRASELSKPELEAGGLRLRQRVDAIEPRVVAVAGVTAYRDAFGHRQARVGRQSGDLAGAELWVVPNPSGLNAHETIDSLTEWYGQVAEAAGIK